MVRSREGDCTVAVGRGVRIAILSSMRGTNGVLSLGWLRSRRRSKLRSAASARAK